MNTIINAQWWHEISLLFYMVAAFLSFTTENTYRKIFALDAVKSLQMTATAILGFIAFGCLFWFTRDRLPSLALVTLATAAGSLLGVYRVDRLLLVIPDRLQIIGAISGLLFLATLWTSGEDPTQLILETLYALAMVALLWGLSYVYQRLRGAIGFGLGDIKLLGWMTLFTGKRMPDLILLAIGFGLLYLALTTLKNSLAAKKLTLPKAQDAFAFGPAIVLAFFAEELIHYA